MWDLSNNDEDFINPAGVQESQFLHERLSSFGLIHRMYEGSLVIRMFIRSAKLFLNCVAAVSGLFFRPNSSWNWDSSVIREIKKLLHWCWAIIQHMCRDCVSNANLFITKFYLYILHYHIRKRVILTLGKTAVTIIFEVCVIVSLRSLKSRSLFLSMKPCTRYATSPA